jgi:hypothetical protein
MKFCNVHSQLAESALAIQWEIEALNMNPDPEPLLMEMIHSVSDFAGHLLSLIVVLLISRQAIGTTPWVFQKLRLSKMCL